MSLNKLTHLEANPSKIFTSCVLCFPQILKNCFSRRFNHDEKDVGVKWNKFETSNAISKFHSETDRYLQIIFDNFPIKYLLSYGNNLFQISELSIQQNYRF